MASAAPVAPRQRMAAAKPSAGSSACSSAKAAPRLRWPPDARVRPRSSPSRAGPRRQLRRQVLRDADREADRDAAASGTRSIGHLTRRQKAGAARPSASAVASIARVVAAVGRRERDPDIGQVHRLCANHRPARLPCHPGAERAALVQADDQQQRRARACGAKTSGAARRSQAPARPRSRRRRAAAPLARPGRKRRGEADMVACRSRPPCARRSRPGAAAATGRSTRRRSTRSTSIAQHQRVERGRARRHGSRAARRRSPRRAAPVAASRTRARQLRDRPQPHARQRDHGQRERRQQRPPRRRRLTRRRRRRAAIATPACARVGGRVGPSTSATSTTVRL